MKKLGFYLEQAKDWTEGTQAVETLKDYYFHNPEKAEELWSKAINAEEKSLDFEEFCNLIEVRGLYVQNEMRKHDDSFDDSSKDVSFELRIYNDFRLGKVACIKCQHLPVTHI